MFFENNPQFKLILATLIQKEVKAEYRMLGNGHVFEHTKTFEDVEDAVKYFQEVEEKMR